LLAHFFCLGKILKSKLHFFINLPDFDISFLSQTKPKKTVCPEVVEGQSRAHTTEAETLCITKLASTCFDKLSTNGFLSAQCR